MLFSKFVVVAASTIALASAANAPIKRKEVSREQSERVFPNLPLATLPNVKNITPFERFLLQLQQLSGGQMSLEEIKKKLEKDNYLLLDNQNTLSSAYVLAEQQPGRCFMSNNEYLFELFQNNIKTNEVRSAITTGPLFKMINDLHKANAAKANAAIVPAGNANAPVGNAALVPANNGRSLVRYTKKTLIMVSLFMALIFLFKFTINVVYFGQSYKLEQSIRGMQNMPLGEAIQSPHIFTAVLSSIITMIMVTGCCY